MLPQECPLAFVYLTWVLFAAGFVYFPVRGDWLLAGVWLLALPLALSGYVRSFPRISRFLGYGRVDDVATPDPGPSSKRVTMYSSLGCPFCPVVERRLRALEQEMGFKLEVVDITLKPDLVLGKKIRSVPVVEVNDMRIVGHATSKQLADLIAEEE